MKDLTKGSITKLMISFAVPVLIGSIFQQLYGIIDTKVVSEKLGETALASMGVVNPVYNLIIGFAIGLTSGFAIIVARHFGAGDIKLMRKSVAGTLILGTVISVAFTVFSLAFIKPILIMLKTSQEHIPLALEYIKIILGSIFITMVYNMFSGILRALGNTKAPLVFLIISSVVNVFLDYIMVDKFGIKGAAWATVISQIISCAMCIVYIVSCCPELHLMREDFSISFSLIRELFSCGFAMMPYSALTATISTFCSQNLGAGNLKRIKQGIRKCIFVAWGWSIFVVVFAYTPLVNFTMEWLIGADKTEAIKIAVYYLKINAPFYFVLAVLLVLRCAMQGLSKGVVPVVSSFIELAGKVAISLILAPSLGYLGVAISEPVIWILCALWLTFSLFTDKKLYPRKTQN